MLADRDGALTEIVGAASDPNQPVGAHIGTVSTGFFRAMGIAAILATAIPALRASRTDPMHALRPE